MYKRNAAPEVIRGLDLSQQAPALGRGCGGNDV